MCVMCGSGWEWLWNMGACNVHETRAAEAIGDYEETEEEEEEEYDAGATKYHFQRRS